MILGHCIQRTDEANTARTAALAAGFPDTVTGYTIQRQCSSGMQAIMSAAMQIQLGVSEVVVAGGVNNEFKPLCIKTTPLGTTPTTRRNS